MKKILIFSLAYHPVVGGAEIAVKEITDRITDAEFDMVTLRFDKSHPKEERIGNVNVYRIDSFKNLFPFKAYWFAKRLHRVKRYDIAWAIMANWAGFAASFFKKKFPDVKFVLTLQEGDPIEYIKKKVRFVYPMFKNIFLRADSVQVISNYLGEFAKSIGYKGEVNVIPNGVDFSLFSHADAEKVQQIEERFSKEEGDVFLITTSRLVKKNAVADIIDALKFLPENFKLLIIGTGPLEKELKAQTKKLGLGERVKFLDHIPYSEIPAYLHASDIFIRPSLSEGMGNSFIEAMAAGVPVVATPVGGITDFLKDGETGLFVEPNSPRLIVFQAQKLVSDRVLRDKVTINAKRMVQEKYDWDLIAGEMRSRVFQS